jgi:hypothetical protein
MAPDHPKPEPDAPLFDHDFDVNGVGGYAIVDSSRLKRTGLPEAIYAPSKTKEQVLAIAKRHLELDGPTIVTRCSESLAAELGEKPYELEVFPPLGSGFSYFTAVGKPTSRTGGRVALVSAGTSDLAVAHEAEATLFALGIESELISDVGVAGIHRLFERLGMIMAADVVIVIAGMEASLASVVGGLVSAPVVAVPTSTGYGSSFEGITATLSMLASCAPGVSIVGIDNGFGAAAVASKILQMPLRQNEASQNEIGQNEIGQNEVRRGTGGDSR